MKWIKILFYNIVIAGILFLLVDFLYTQINPPPGRHPSYITSHSDFHHTLKSSYKHINKWGTVLCTDKNGFKTHCDNLDRSSLSFDVVFIGDSFTEGLGLPYEDTFVGMYDLSHPGIDVANLGVKSYSPTRYLQKISHYLDKGLKTKHVIAFIDPYDFKDEIAIKTYQSSIIYPSFAYPELVRFMQTNFTFTTNIGYYIRDEFIRDLIRCMGDGQFRPQCSPADAKPTKTETADAKPTKTELADAKIEPASVTPQKKLPDTVEHEYFKSSGAIERSLSKMEALYKLLNEHEIKLSVAVYPWPPQLKYNSPKNHYVEIWEEFCENKCFAFVNTFPAFFRLKEQLGLEKIRKKYYLVGDFHFNKTGNELILEVLNKEFKTN